MSYSFSNLTEKLTKAEEHIRQEVALLRTGRAAVQILDPVKVEAYGTMMAVNELANVSAPDPNMLVVSPWDKSLLENIAKGISISGLNLNPVVDGDIIRITIPPLTEERRREMVKLLHQKIEQGKVMIRTIRAEIKQEIEDQKGEGGVSEDDIKLDLEQLEKKIKEAIDALDVIAAEKEKELMTV